MAGCSSGKGSEGKEEGMKEYGIEMIYLDAAKQYPYELKPLTDQEELANLEYAIEWGGRIPAYEPACPTGFQLAQEGLAEKEDPSDDSYYGMGGSFLITEAGRRFVAERVPPAEW